MVIYINVDVYDTILAGCLSNVDVWLCLFPEKLVLSSLWLILRNSCLSLVQDWLRVLVNRATKRLAQAWTVSIRVEKIAGP